jgi:serine protease Do
MCIAACLFAYFTVSPPAWAQTTIPAALERRGVLTPEKRAQLSSQLRKQAEIFEAQSAVVRTISKLVGPAVVHISADSLAHTTLQVGRGRHVEEAGSGVIIEWKDRLYVLTNRHVVHDSVPQSIKIELEDGQSLTPDKVWEDQETDVAVLSSDTLNQSRADVVTATVGDSDGVDIGDFVLAIGSPFGLSRSVTFGIISAKQRHDLKLDDAGLRFQDFLQTDAAINPGNSGGPLINLHGEIIGINTAIASQSGGSEGIGFAIPVNMFMSVARQLIERGVVQRAFMGVNLEPNFGPAMAAELGLPRRMGALVTSVTPHSPADVARLQARDVIFEFNGRPVKDESHLINMVSMTEIGKTVPLVIYRDRSVMRLNIEVGDRSKFLPAVDPYEQR